MDYFLMEKFYKSESKYGERFKVLRKERVSSPFMLK